jgi:hypothetical protein
MDAIPCVSIPRHELRERTRRERKPAVQNMLPERPE